MNDTPGVSNDFDPIHYLIPTRISEEPKIDIEHDVPLMRFFPITFI
jgi:hypothetical protein